MGRPVALVCCAAVLALVAAGRASAFSTQQLTLTMDDDVPLAATLYTPDGAPPPGGFPAIVALHGLGGDRGDLDAVASRFASRYVVLTFDARGHGASGGLVSIDGPREIADTRAMYAWLAARSQINPSEIGAWGISLGGGAVLRSLVEGVPWAAVETVETWTDLYTGLAPQNLSKSGAVYQFLSSVPADHLDPAVAAIEADAIASRNLAVLRQFTAARSSRPLLPQVHTPVLFFQGRRDFAFDIDQASAGFSRVKGPKQLFVGDFGHSPSRFPGPDFDAVMKAGQSWFDRWLLHQPLAPWSPVVVSPDPWRGKTRAFKRLPPTRVSHVAFPGTNRLTGAAAADRTSSPLGRKLETFGAGRVHLTATISGGWERLVAVLAATTPRHRTIVVSEGGINTRGMHGRRRLTIRLISDATLIPRGSKLRLTLAPSSLAQSPANLLYLDLPQPPGARVTLGPARLDLPVLRTAISR